MLTQKNSVVMTQEFEDRILTAELDSSQVFNIHPWNILISLGIGPSTDYVAICTKKYWGLRLSILGYNQTFLTAGS